MTPVAGRITVQAGRPAPTAGDQRLTSSSCDRYAPAMDRGAIHGRNRRFAELGIDLFQLQLRGDAPEFYTTPYWTDDGVYGVESDDAHPATLSRQAQAILEVHPGAWFSIALFITPPADWAARYPDEMQTDSDGRRWRNASLASDRFLDGMDEYLRRVVRHTQAQPWGSRVIGYVLIPHMEGLSEMTIHGALCDHSAAMHQRFRVFLRETYPSVDALRAAWNDPGVTFDTAAPPTDAEWHADRSGWLTFPEPSQTVRYRDYFRLQRELLRGYLARSTRATKQAAAPREVFVAVDALKQPMAGWLLLDAFSAAGHGMAMPDTLTASGSFDVGKLLDLPDLDGLMTPADYTARSVGLGFEPEGIADSLTLRGKLMFLEDDARSWIRPNFRDEQGAWRNPREGRAGFTRNLATSWSRGFFPHWANVSVGYFDHDDVMALIADVLPLHRRMLTAPLGHTAHAVAMIIDDSAGLHTDFTSGFQQLAVLQQRTAELVLMGLPYRVYLFSDLERDDFPDHRLYLFPNLLHLDSGRIELLRRKILRNGAVAVFGPATGVAAGNADGAQAASDLLGIPLERVERRMARRVYVPAGTHPALADLPAAQVYGDSYAFGPLLHPVYADDPTDWVELGKGSTHWEANRTGLAIREFGRGAAGNGIPGERGAGDAATVFSVATPLPAALLRSLAMYAGCVPWSRLGDAVFTDGKMLAIHTGQPGRRTVTLPAAADIEDLSTGAIVATNTVRFSIDLAAPETRVFRLVSAEKHP